MTIETRIASRLIDAALARGYVVSVNDGEAWAIKRSSSKKDIMSSLASTDSDSLVFRNANGERMGSMLLIWGNGFDVISDFSDNDDMNALVLAAE